MSTSARVLLLTASAALVAGCGSDAEEAAPVDYSGIESFTAGTYDVEAEYNNPDGITGIAVSVTIDEKGTVSDVVVTPEAPGGNGLMFQQIFAENIAAEVVGKPITEISVDKVAGSSLTSQGFNSAIAAVIEQAGVTA